MKALSSILLLVLKKPKESNNSQRVRQLGEDQ